MRGRIMAVLARTWAGAGIRLFILVLIGALIFVVARVWDWWVGSSTLQSTNDAHRQADLAPLAAKVPGFDGLYSHADLLQGNLNRDA